jgi:hypothetical protein
VFTKHGQPHVFTGPPAMFGIHLGKQVVHSARDIKPLCSSNRGHEPHILHRECLAPTGTGRRP